MSTSVTKFHLSRPPTTPATEGNSNEPQAPDAPEIALTEEKKTTLFEDVKQFPVVISNEPIEPVKKPEDIADFMNLIAKIKASMIKDSDKVTIQGKEYITKSGWRKMAFAFGISDEIYRSQRIDKPDGTFMWYVWVRAIHRPSGRTADGLGVCASNERRFAHMEHDVLAQAHTRAKNRAISDIVGSGDISYEEIGE